MFRDASLKAYYLTCHCTLVDMSYMISINSLLIQRLIVDILIHVFNYVMLKNGFYLEVRGEEMPTVTAVENFLRPAGQNTTTTFRAD